MQTALKRYDLLVIGGGPGGYVAAIKGAQLGLRVACIEGRGALGGTCLNVGWCIPVNTAFPPNHFYTTHIYTAQLKGLLPEESTVIQVFILATVKLNLPNMMKAKQASIDGLTAGVAHLLKASKADYVKGWATFKSPTSVDVALEDGSKTTIDATNIVIATGSEAMHFPGIEIDETSIVTSTGALTLKKVPESMLVIGGGIIGLELGSVWCRLGAKLTVVEFNAAIGGGMDDEVAKSFQRILQKQGMSFKLGHKVISAKKQADGKVCVVFEPAAGGKQDKIIVDVVLVSIGRKPNTLNLGLEKAGVKIDAKGRIVTDHAFKTNVPSIRAIGDVIVGPMLAHKAEEEGIAVVEHLVHSHGHVNYAAIPSVVYTWPEVAWVGQNEQQLKNDKIPYKIGKFPFSANSRAKTIDDKEGFVKILSHATTDAILGAHIIGPAAGEMIAEGVLAMEYGASSEDIARTCHAHPTLSEAFKEACMATYDRAIHM